MSSLNPSGDWKSIARTIDHTLLRTAAPRDAVMKLCREASHYRFRAVVVQPYYVALVAGMLRGSQVLAASVVGFPQGATLATVKQFEARQLLRQGAQELDMVLNVAALKSGDRNYVANEVKSLAQIVHSGGAILKVIIEAPLLTREEKILACEICVESGADYVKTATGMGAGGATVEDVRLMRSIVGSRAGVKAAGGIRTAADAVAMLAAGADRLGTSSSVAIMRELGVPEI